MENNKVVVEDSTFSFTLPDEFKDVADFIFEFSGLVLTVRGDFE